MLNESVAQSWPACGLPDVMGLPSACSGMMGFIAQHLEVYRLTTPAVVSAVHQSEINQAMDTETNMCLAGAFSSIWM